MPTATRSFYAARGDYELYGLNQALAGLALAREDLVAFEASRATDGVWVTLTYEEHRALRLDFSSIGQNAWFQEGTTPSSIVLGFNTAVNEAEMGTFKWIWSSDEETVLSGGISITEYGKLVEVDFPTLPVDYTGPLTIVGTELLNDEGYEMDEPLSISLTITDPDMKLPQTGNEPYSRDRQVGKMQVSRMIGTPGTDIEELVAQFVEHKGLAKKQIIRVLQSRGPDGSTEIFLLWWQGSAPKVTKIAPGNHATVSQKDLPSQIFFEFDEAVDEALLRGDDGTDRLLFDGTRYQDHSATLVKIDNRGTQWVLKGLANLGVLGSHTLLIRPVPTEFGEHFSPPMLFGWQSLDVEAATGSGPTSNWQCDELLPGDGIRVDFTLSAAPVGCPVMVYMNGMFQDPDCYTLVANTLTFLSPPFDGAKLWAMYEA